MAPNRISSITELTANSTPMADVSVGVPEIHLFNLFGQERHSPIWLFNCEMCGFGHP